MSSPDSLINTSCYYEERFQLTHVIRILYQFVYIHAEVVEVFGFRLL